jgi:hypothetical protein
MKNNPIMTDVQKLEQTGSNAVKTLRIDKLRKGMPFMINAKELPGNQCYLEFPDGKILLVTISSAGSDFTVLRELSGIENADIRKKYHLA